MLAPKSDERINSVMIRASRWKESHNSSVQRTRVRFCIGFFAAATSFLIFILSNRYAGAAFEFRALISLL